MKMKKLIIASILAGATFGLAGSASAGSVFLTGHDIDFHNNADGYSTVILNWLRGAGTASEIPAASYNIGVLSSTGVGTFNSPPGFTVTIADPTSFATGADFAAFLVGKSAIEIASHTSCGGCALSTAGSNAINSFSTQIAAFFNAGGDIWANTGGTLATYYNFLPPGAVATGAAISGSTGFVVTPAGTAIGITDEMANGDQTHNRFTSFAPAFTVFETRAADEFISIGIRDATITDGGIIITPPPTDGVTPPPTGVPEPSTLALLGVAIAALGLRRRRA